MGSRPRWTDFHKNWQGCRGWWRNHAVHFWFQYFQGFQIYRGSKFLFSRWFAGHRYNTADATVQRVIYLAIEIWIWTLKSIWLYCVWMCFCRKRSVLIVRIVSGVSVVRVSSASTVSCSFIRNVTNCSRFPADLLPYVCLSLCLSACPTLYLSVIICVYVCVIWSQISWRYLWRFLPSNCIWGCIT